MPSPRGTKIVLNTGALGRVWQNVIEKRHIVLLPSSIEQHYRTDSVRRAEFAGLASQLNRILGGLESAGLVRRRCHKVPLSTLNPQPRFHKLFLQYAVGEQARFFVTPPRDWPQGDWRTFAHQFSVNHGVAILTSEEYVVDP